MTSKCGKNKKRGTRGAAECVTDVLTTRLYKMKQTDWLLGLAKNCDWFKFKIQKIFTKLNQVLSSSMRLSSSRSQVIVRNARITWVII